jgi:hypothetical protein
MKLKLVLLYVVILSLNMRSQSIGTSLGGGIISGKSPNVSSFTSTLFFETPGLFNNSFSVRLSFLYAVDYNQILPNTTNMYNPFIRGISLKGIATQDISSSYYIDEGLGALLLDDRIISGIEVVDYGFVISVGAGIDLRKGAYSGAKIGAGADFGFTFTNSYANYFSISLIGQYYF